jgi:hypothetical protein
MIVKIKGITKHGKNRVHEHGDEWRIIEDHPLTPRPSDPFIESVKTGDRRWLNHNFIIVGKV